LIVKADEAILTGSEDGMIFKPRRLTTSGWMKLSELPLSIKLSMSIKQSIKQVALVVVLSEAAAEEEAEERQTLALSVENAL
ncbi:hypothetical protein T4E_3872, partial [Trichinella pseudospiralis]